MSAIFGLFNLDGQPAPIEELHRMNAALAMHGPDGNGIWCDGHVGLGQRLMCFTPEDLLERQPLRGGEGNYTLVTDGRVDNRPELTEALGIPAAEARELPDSAFILRAYEKWGVECCGHLIGDFAFALYDRREDRLVVAKSAMSKRSIYYREAAGRFAFSSAPKGLFALPWVPRAIDHQSLADYLVHAPRDPGRSFYAGVSELYGGHILVVNGTGCALRDYWQPSCRELRFDRDSDYLEAFNALFERVIADNLRSLTPVGVSLSGGLDSTSVAVTAARRLSIQGKRLTAFTEVPRAGFETTVAGNRYPDETPLVRAVAQHCDLLDLNFIRTDGCLLLDRIDQFFEAVEGPLPLWNRPWIEAILRNAREWNTRVLLTGGSGNLTISRNGDGLVPELILQGRWLRALREARSLAKLEGKESTLKVLVRGGAALLPTRLWHLAGRFFRSSDTRFRGGGSWQDYSVIRPEFARLHRVGERGRERGRNFYMRLERLNRANRYRDVRRQGLGYLSAPGLEALTEVQYRDPCGDARIVEFCISLPEEQNCRNGVRRSLIRRAMADRLPIEVLTNRRRGLQAADWLERARAGRSQLLDELAMIEHSELAQTALDLRRIRSLLEEMPDPGFAVHMASLEYRAMLGSGLMTGSFIRWFDSSSRVLATGAPAG